MSKLLDTLNKINKEYKDKIAFSQVTEDFSKGELIPFSSPRLNHMCYGGLPRGRLIEFSGPEGSGKTTTALDVIKNCQRIFKKEYETGKTKLIMKCAFIDAENTFDSEWAKKLGVDTENLVIIRPQQQYAEQIFNIMKELIETEEVGLLILDSVAQLVSKQAYETDMEGKTYGGIASVLTKFCNIVVPLLSRYNCTCIMLNQVREDMNNPYNEFITPGGRSFKHNCSLRLTFKQGDFFDVNNHKVTRGTENPAGNLVNVRVLKTKVFRPDRKLGFYTLNYLEGIDYVSDMIDVLIKNGIIVQGGAWFSIVDENGELMVYKEKELKFQGKHSIHKAIKEDEELFALLESKISYD
jgi:recA bacterial DNA recombination protein